MNREIKFRAWFNGEMIYQDFHIAAPGHGWIWKDFQMTRSEIFIAPIMQYTGLKDKNGKEIYEGDIVKLHAYPHTTDAVKFENGMFSFGYGLPIGLDTEGNQQFSEDIMEVIGNIYENLELL